jgi:hypothetical protein
MTARRSQPESQRQGAPCLLAGTPEDMTSPPEALDRFWRLAEPLLARPGVTRSTMMGLPCLRLDGAFFASCDRRTGDLLVKLPETRVGELIEAGIAHAFAPAGRPFRQWAAIPPGHFPAWKPLLGEAALFAATSPARTHHGQPPAADPGLPAAHSRFPLPHHDWTVRYSEGLEWQYAG